ncbi:arsinothricin resistance N-acetyltransferase ArsN1 family B [Glaciimonas soli]|uniref:GNAT family N-acetyltransferase n=1 Tax=Glaciimonas soli TaxID=2590999 RepID=A0A843YYE9_9BURK|nr:arsinothricin resistance N-acetyltransferase ArsN1 family B [Glaciimonas soli]MQR01556.1 GNAT family N-acetyltransferase [Glaciimonas soli]
MQTIIRPASIADAEAICHIYNHYVLNTSISFESDVVSTQEMAQRITEVTATYSWLVCVQDERIVGYAYASKWRVRAAYQHAVESSVYLAHDVGGKGFGSLLYRALIEELKKLRLPIHTVIGGVALPNAGSVALHEKCGFEKVAHFREVGKKFGKWIDVGYWQLVLQPQS